MQHPKQCVFIPSGWQHLVVNLEFTAAVTENFLEPRNFRKAWKICVEQRQDFANQWKWYLSPRQIELAQELTPNFWSTKNIEVFGA